MLGSIAAFYVFMAPYTKVGESFNVQVRCNSRIFVFISGFLGFWVFQRFFSWKYLLDFLFGIFRIFVFSRICSMKYLVEPVLGFSGFWVLVYFFLGNIWISSIFLVLMKTEKWPRILKLLCNSRIICFYFWGFGFFKTSFLDLLSDQQCVRSNICLIFVFGFLRILGFFTFFSDISGFFYLFGLDEN